MSISQRRDEWTALATDYAHEHGLIGLTLRPLAAALGTSDRMLIYHFGSKDELLAAILRESNERSSTGIAALPPSADLRSAVHDLWAAVRSPALEACSQLYVEASALGLLGREPYASVIGEANRTWMKAVVDHLVQSGVARPLATRAARIVDAAFMGFELDLPMQPNAAATQRAVADLADAVAALESLPR